MPGQFEASREGQLSEEKLKWGYWWVTHRIQVRRWFSVVLGVTGFCLVAYSAFGIADWYLGSGVTERAALGQLTVSSIPYDAYNASHAPQSLAVDSPLTLVGGQGSYDFVASVTNPNKEWRANFTYHFEAGGLKTPVKPGYLLPGDTTWLDALGQKSDSSPGSAVLRFDTMGWQRVDLHFTRPDYRAWAASRLDLETGDIKFVRPAATDPLNTSRASFTLTNNTGYSYHSVGLIVTLWGAGDQLLGVNDITISDLRAGDQRPVEAVWFSDVPGVTGVEVKPVVDIFDPKAYIAPGQ